MAGKKEKLTEEQQRQKLVELLETAQKKLSKLGQFQSCCR
jgi:hypothetical protein